MVVLKSTSMPHAGEKSLSRRTRARAVCVCVCACKCKWRETPEHSLSALSQGFRDLPRSPLLRWRLRAPFNSIKKGWAPCSNGDQGTLMDNCLLSAARAFTQVPLYIYVTTEANLSTRPTIKTVVNLPSPVWCWQLNWASNIKPETQFKHAAIQRFGVSEILLLNWQ